MGEIDHVFAVPAILILACFVTVLTTAASRRPVAIAGVEPYNGALEVALPVNSFFGPMTALSFSDRALWFVTAAVTAAGCFLFAAVFFPREASIDEKLVVAAEIDRTQKLVMDAYWKVRTESAAAAVPLMEAAGERAEDSPLAQFVWGSIYSEQGDYKAAEDHFTKLIELHDIPAHGYNSRGAMRGRLGDLEGAIADFTRALELDPELSTARMNRGVALMRLGKDAKAMDDLDAIIAAALQPIDCISAYEARAILLYRQGKPDAALADLDAVVASEVKTPFLVDVYYNRSELRRAMGDGMGAKVDKARYKEALVQYKDRLDSSGRPRP